MEAALLRATINARLGKHAEALKEYDYLVSLHPRSVTLARAAERSCLVSRDVPQRVVSEWATGSERRKGRVQRNDMEGRPHMIDTLAAE